MKRVLVLLFIVLLAVGCSSKTIEEETKPTDVEEPIEIVEVEETDEIINDEDVEVLVKYEESFDEDISDDWLISKYVTLEPSPQGVYYENGTVRLVAEETDRAPILSSTPYAIEDAKYITINAKLKTSFANEYYTGAMGIFFTDSPDMEVEVNADSWSSSFGRRPIQTEYVNYFSDSSRRIIDNGFILYTSSEEHGSNIQAFESGVFNEWFTQQFVINMETGEVTCTINDETLTSMIDIPEESYLRIWVHPYGWFTGHEVVIDSIDIYFSK
jgi:hypothetical protein